jgi:hypothetical protein
MDKIIQTQALELFQTLREGLSHAAREDAKVVLPMCLQAVDAIYATLHDNLSEKRFLEYAHTLERAADSIVGWHETNIDSHQVKSTDKALKKLVYTLENESEVKLEIVFLPYKASMWDALESVYLAAAADLRVNAYVVPIPYYEMKLDQTPGEWVYEGEQFPEEIPVTDFRKYDLAARKPDIAYIHNPYDDKNLITQVVPEYFTNALKKHVKKLVYVPYYVSRFKNQPHFYDVAAQTAADVIIAQNDEAADLFKRAAPDKTVLALGSPKTDRILRLDAEKPEMPPKWARILNGKKIFLLNTSINSLLKHSANFTKKIAEVMDAVAGIPGAALLWRPHPLTKAGINTMRPYLLREYQKLIARIKGEGIGVLDETADVERAIALADAYVGESSSSVAFMFALTGKPLLYLRYDMDEPDFVKQWTLRTTRAYPGFRVYDGDEVWFAEQQFNRLMCFDSRTGETADHGSLCDDPKIGWSAYVSIAKSGRFVCAAPNTAAEFVLYDTQTGDAERVPVPEALRGKCHHYFSPFLYNGKYWFVPVSAKALAAWDPETNDIFFDERFYAAFEPLAPAEATYYVGEYVLTGAVLWVCVRHCNALLAYDLETGLAQIHCPGKGKHGYTYAAYDGKDFWLNEYRELISDDSIPAIYRYNPQTGKTAALNKFPEGFSHDRDRGDSPYGDFLQMFCVNDRTYVFPGFANMSLIIDQKNNRISEWPLLFDKENSIGQALHSPFIYTQLIEESIITAYSTQDGCLFTVNTETGRTTKTSLPLPEGFDVITPLREMNKAAVPPIMEDLAVTVPVFLGWVTSSGITLRNTEQTKKERANVLNCDGSCGQKVHESVMQRLNA